MTALDTTPAVPATDVDVDVDHFRSSLSVSAGVSTDPEVLVEHSVDRSSWRPEGLPVAVVWATRTSDVVATVRFAAANGLSVVPRGAGTGLSGGAGAGRGTLVLDLSRMDRILSVDAVDGLAEVEPGVITADLDRAARAVGLRYAPDPASWTISTIGGNIATNAGGLRCAKYGVTGDSVAALTVVLADGSVVHTGRQTIKGVVGYDLTRLFVGSEGTLGIIVGATLRLSPVPAHTATASATFDSPALAAAAVLELAGAGVRPATLELLDQATLTAIDQAQGTSLASYAGALLLLQTDGYGAEPELRAAVDILARTASRIEVAADEAEAEHLLSTRRLALPSVQRLGPVLIGDVAVPRSRLAEAMAGISDIARTSGVQIFTFAHAGDGNLHPLLVVDEERLAEVHQAEDRIFRLALDLGGTLSGEHGVGVLKRPWVDAEIDEPTSVLHRAVKDALDPSHVLNAGKGAVGASTPSNSAETTSRPSRRNRA